jgi:oxygen-independent coproporphyrinogen-3 oxidase
MPHLFRSQLLISDMELPSAAEKLDLLHFSIQTLEAAGYVYIGMDHFAKPNDELVRAQRAGKLQRNFQGYSTHKDCDLLAVGVSSISMIDNIYVQNAKDLNAYQQKLDLSLLPIARGFSLNGEDVLRRFVINSLICHLELDFAQVEQEFFINPAEYFATEIAQLAPMIEDGLVTVDDHGIRVHNKGRLLIRRVCMVFDEYLQKPVQSGNQVRYSKII